MTYTVMTRVGAESTARTWKAAQMRADWLRRQGWDAWVRQEGGKLPTTNR